MSTGSPTPPADDDRRRAPATRDGDGPVCEVVPEGGALRVRVRGALDLATVPVVAARLDELRTEGWRRFVVDLGGLDFMDSTGLRLILEWDADARQDGWEFQLLPGPRAVQRVFEVTGTVHRLPFVDA